MSTPTKPENKDGKKSKEKKNANTEKACGEKKSDDKKKSSKKKSCKSGEITQKEEPPSIAMSIASMMQPDLEDDISSGLSALSESEESEKKGEPMRLLQPCVHEFASVVRKDSDNDLGLQSQDVADECPRSVKLSPFSLFIPLPVEKAAVDARMSHQKVKGSGTTDKRRKSMVQKTIHELGGYVIDQKNKNKYVKVKAGTPMPKPAPPKPLILPPLPTNITNDATAPKPKLSTSTPTPQKSPSSSNSPSPKNPK